MSEILVVGSMAYDSIQTPSGRVDRALGGSANYFSLAASRSAKVRVVGVVGNDYSTEDKKLLEDRGVDLSGMTVAPGKTFHWEGYYEGDLNQAITRKTELNVFEHFNPVLPSHYTDSKFVFLANISPDLQGKVLDQVKKPLFSGMDTMNFWISSKLPDLKATLARVDVVLINEGEAMQLTGKKNAVEAAPAVCAMGPSAVVIKRGEYGFLMFGKGQGYFILPAMPIPEVIDPTGAGDTFAGGFFGSLAKLDRRPDFDDMKRAAIHGTIMASFTIQDFGVKALARIEGLDFQTRLQSYRQIVTIP